VPPDADADQSDSFSPAAVPPGVRDAHPIDRLMDRASLALAETRYFDAANDAAHALNRARRENDFERMARICLPLQEARRQIRQLATDTAAVRLVAHPEDIRGSLEPACYLIQPPMIGADARVLRETAFKRRVPVSVLAREPLTRKGLWPIVGVGEISVRVQIAPPVPLERADDRITRDRFEGPVPIEWFEAAGEALGDSAIAALDPALHPHWRVDELMEALEAVPEHERLHQALAAACRDAAGTEPPVGRRPSPLDNPFSF
jgi:hypothetical protein